MDINELNTITIPIVVDSVKNIDDFKMTRCTYFSIENNEPGSEWSLDIDHVSIRFLMVGLSGIIFSPSGNDELLFDTPDKYEQLFQAIEEQGGLYVDMSEIWLPNKLFQMEGRTVERGDVFRVSYNLFKIAYSLQDKFKSNSDFMESINQMDASIVVKFSENETSALKLWNDLQIEINQKKYHENTKMQLGKKDNDQKPFPTLTN